MAKANTAAQSATPAQFKRKGAVTVPSLSVANMVEGDSLFIRIEGEIFDKPDLDKNGKQKVDADTDQPIFLHIARVTNMVTGELAEIVFGHIVVRALNDYKEAHGTYVGKSFEMLKGAKKGRTIMWSVFEIDAEESAT